jgi:hypothetical protein
MGLASLESDRKWKDLSVSTDYRSAVALGGGEAEGPEYLRAEEKIIHVAP